METIIAFVIDFFRLCKELLTWMLDGFLYVLKTVLYLPFDGILTVITSFVSSLDVGQLVFNSASTWGLLPPQMLYVINAVGFPQGLTLVAYAIVIRMTLNLIPAALTRL
ncbi:MAG: hypothetical protein ACYC2W_03675 [Desulfurivibrionaceae bacterium]